MLPSWDICLLGAGVKGQVLSIASLSVLFHSVISNQDPKPEKTKQYGWKILPACSPESFKQYPKFLRRTVEGSGSICAAERGADHKAHG